ncbi:MAG TPA: hypothetical protein PKE47_08105, partial [Verrucomicrobiota bacterium]|nr:hypothetical protein [Verrucomicrobiota bacterium]
MSPRVCCLGLLLLALGCGKPAEDVAEAAPGTSATAIAGDVVPPEPVPMDAIRAELPQAVRRYGAERRAVPKGLEELATHGY